MIIISQDERSIINFDNVENIDIAANLDGTGEVPYYINYETCSKREELGRYKTEERAKEVLQEIIQRYENAQSKIGKTYISLEKYDFVYVMPKE